MEDWQKRVVEERDDLEKKIQKLNQFMDSKDYAKIPYKQQEHLQSQIRHMDAYYKVLGNRITSF